MTCQHCLFAKQEKEQSNFVHNFNQHNKCNKCNEVVPYGFQCNKCNQKEIKEKVQENFPKNRKEINLTQLRYKCLNCCETNIGTNEICALCKRTRPPYVCYKNHHFGNTVICGVCGSECDFII